MRQLLNHFNCETAFVNSEPNNMARFSHVRYWVEYSLHLNKDRLFMQRWIQVAGKWASPKWLGSADVIILLQHPFESDMRGMVEPILWEFKQQAQSEIVHFCQSWVFTERQQKRLLTFLSNDQLYARNLQIIWKVSSELEEPPEPQPRSSTLVKTSRKDLVWSRINPLRDSMHGTKTPQEWWDVYSQTIPAQFQEMNRKLYEKWNLVYLNLFDAQALEQMELGQTFMQNLKFAIEYVDKGGK